MSERVSGWTGSPDDPVEPMLEEGLAEAPPPSVQHDGDAVTTGTIPVVVDDPPPVTRPVRSPVGRWLAVFFGLCALVGGLAGLAWWLVVPLTTYRVGEDGLATTSERGLAGYPAGDSWFVLFGVILGAVVALWCWRWFGGLGWPATLITIGGSLVMAGLCWAIGWLLGPGPLSPRLATAQPGQDLPIELTVRAPTAVLAWPFVALMVLMLISAISPDPEDADRPAI